MTEELPPLEAHDVLVQTRTGAISSTQPSWNCFLRKRLLKVNSSLCLNSWQGVVLCLWRSSSIMKL